MRCNRAIRPLLASLLMPWLFLIAPVATAQEEESANGDAAEETEERPVRMSIVHKGPGRKSDGLAALFPEQVRELEANGKTFAGLFLPQETPAQQGGAVIIPDVGRSPAHGLPAGLRRALPESGWSTLAISLPESLVDPLPKRIFRTRSAAAEEAPEDDGGAEQDGAADQQTDTEQEGDDARAMTIEVTQGQRQHASGDEREPWRDAAMARVGAAVQLMRDQGIQNIVLVGIGDGADLTLRYTQVNAAMFPPGGIGLVWLDARFRAPYNGPLDEVLGEGYAIPVLDLYDRDRTGASAPQRQKAARRGSFQRYTQSALPMPRQSRRAAERRLGSWVAGWLNENMAGMETQ